MEFRCFSGDDLIPMHTVAKTIVGFPLRITCPQHLIMEGVFLVNDLDTHMHASECVDLTSDSESEADKCIRMACENPAIDDDCGNMVTIHHFPPRDATFLMCQTPSLVEEVQKVVSRNAIRQVSVYEIDGVSPDIRDTHVLAISEHIPADQVCIAWLDVVSRQVSIEVVDKESCECQFIRHGQCFPRQSPREVLMLKQKELLGSDEFAWIAQQLNLCRDDGFIHSPMIIKASTGPCVNALIETLSLAWKRKITNPQFLLPRLGS